MSLRCMSIAWMAALGLGGASAFAGPGGVQKIVAPTPSAGDYAGNAVAVDADSMVVGVPGSDGPAGLDQGQVLVFRWVGGEWRFDASLRAADAAAGDQFGNAVAITGDTIVVGAYRADLVGRADAGAVYVFGRGASGWSQRAKVVAADAAAGGSFGNAVSLTGDTLLACANAATVGDQVAAGAAYVYTRSGGSWVQQAKLAASDGRSFDFFGISGVVRGDAAVIGAFGVDGVGQADMGAAYVFTRSGSAWSQRSKVLAPGGVAGDQFGISVAIDGETAVIGASGDDVSGRVDQGAVVAYAFDPVSGRCGEPRLVVDPFGQAGDRFGLSLDLRGNSLAVGSMGRSAERGAAVMLERQGSEWTVVATLAAPDASPGDHFGRSVALAADSVAVGAVDDAVCGRASQGSVWVFPRTDGRWRLSGTMVADAQGVAGDSFGNAVAFAGDIMVVGVPLDGVGANPLQGSAIVYRRDASGWVQEARLVAADGAAGDRFGNVVAASADTIVIGSYLADVDGQSDQGAAYVFVRSGGAWVQQAKLVAPDGVANDKFGNAVAVEGDTVAVGVSGDTVGTDTLRGSVHVFERSGASWTRRQQLFAADGNAYDYFGSSLAISGDTLLVGAFFAGSDGGVDAGAAYVFDRSASVWSQSAKLVQSDGQAFDYFGVSVAIEGDLAVVGAFFDDRGAAADQGSATVFVRRAGIWSRQATLIAPDGGSSDGFGIGVAIDADLCVVGAIGKDSASGTDTGDAYVFRRIGEAWRFEQSLVGVVGCDAMPWVNQGGGIGYAVAVQGELVAVSGRGINVNGNASQGAVVLFDAPSGGSSVASNITRGLSYGSLAEAVAGSLAGDQIVASPAAFANAGSIDTIGRTTGIVSSGSIRTSAGSTLSLGGGSLLAAAPDAQCEINGVIQSSAGGTPYVSASAFQLGSRGRLSAKVGTSLGIFADRCGLDGVVRVEPAAHLAFVGAAVEACGSLRVEQGASLSSEGPFRLSSSLAAAADSTLTFRGGLSSAGTLSVVNGQVMTTTLVNADDRLVEFSGAVSLFGSLVNHGQFNVFGSSAIFGDFSNAAFSTTTIRSGTLFLFGSLENQGSILGTLCATCSGMPPGMEVGGNLILGPASNLLLPFQGAQVRLGGHFDCAIDDPGRLDLSVAELVLDGTHGEQFVEVMSRDVGVDQAGFSRAVPGGFPLGALRVMSGSTVTLVDRRANVAGGPVRGEVVYVRRLVVETGGTLRTAGITVYHEDADIQGEVDDESRLVSMRPPCPADFSRDGGVDGTDVLAFFASWEAAEQACDLNGDGAVDGQDVSEFFSHWEAGC